MPSGCLPSFLPTLSAMEDLSGRLQRLGLEHKVAVSLKKTEPHYVLGLAAQHMGSEAGRLVAASSSNFTVRLFSRSRLAQTNVITGHEDIITGIQFLHTDPNLLMTSSEDKTLRLWDPRTSVSKEVQRFTGGNDTECRLLSCDVSVSDRVLCAGTEKAEDNVYLLFWDRRKNKLLGCYGDSHDDDITQVHFHPVTEGSLLSGSTDGLVNVFDIQQTSEDDALLSTYNTEQTVEKAGWCGAEFKQVYCTTHVSTFHVWDSESDEDILQVCDFAERLQDQCKVEYLVDCLPLSSSASTSGDDLELHLVAGNHSGDLHLVTLTQGEELKAVQSLTGGHRDTVRALHWDQETGSLVTGGEDSLLCLWSAHSLGGSVSSSSSKHQVKVKGKKLRTTKRTAPYSGR